MKPASKFTEFPIRYAGNLKQEINSGRPVVALESTIITHGMPWPDNYLTATAVETVIREHGAQPATVAVLDGTLCIGLTDSELQGLAQTDRATKLSTADLPACLLQGKTGSTTVAATMCAAHHAGIRIFATGGIGGVHQDVNTSYDISADLTELSRTPVTVVCAGAKAILDIPKTFELLETLAVPVVVWQSDTIPAFWSSQSELAAPLRFDEPTQVSRFMQLREQLSMAGGILICNPVPHQYEIPFADMKHTINQALKMAAEQNLRGKQVTPFLLDKIYQLTSGASLETNICLIKNNAALAADLARAISA